MKPRKVRKPLPRSTKPLPRSTKPIKRSPLPPTLKSPKGVNRTRKSREWTRAYGSHDRVLFVKLLPCIVAGCPEPSENAHTANGGMSRKAAATTIVPACRGHHRFMHEQGIVSFARSFPLRNGLSLAGWAAETERLWDAYLTALEGE